jgi:hypothetical protein
MFVLLEQGNSDGTNQFVKLLVGLLCSVPEGLTLDLHSSCFSVLLLFLGL